MAVKKPNLVWRMLRTMPMMMTMVVVGVTGRGSAVD